MRFSSLALAALCCALSAPLLDPATTHPHPGAFAVVSLNLASRSDTVADLMREIGPAGPLGGADFYLFQEVAHPSGQPDVANEIARRLSFHSFFTPSNPGPAGGEIGLAIVSRYPLQKQQVLPLPRYNLTFRSRVRIAQHATAETPRGPVHLFNVHLDTRLNLADRLAQLHPVLESAARCDGPVLLGGDFNTNPMRWFGGFIPFPAGHAQTRGTSERLASLGFGSALPIGRTTHDLPGFQLDWVFARGLAISGAEVRPLTLSDHHALTVHLDHTTGLSIRN